MREGEIRLNGTYAYNLWSGRVEIFLSGEWGTVCDNGVDNNDARVSAANWDIMCTVSGQISVKIKTYLFVNEVSGKASSTAPTTTPRERE